VLALRIEVVFVWYSVSPWQRKQCFRRAHTSVLFCSASLQLGHVAQGLVRRRSNAHASFCAVNLPFSTEDVTTVCSSYGICAELKPQFYCPGRGALIKATKPFERLGLDFKGPLPSQTRNIYLLVVVDD